MLSPVIQSNATGLPLNASINEKDFKLLFLDVGLVKYSARIDATVLLHQDFTAGQPWRRRRTTRRTRINRSST